MSDLKNNELSIEDVFRGGGVDVVKFGSEVRREFPDLAVHIEATGVFAPEKGYISGRLAIVTREPLSEKIMNSIRRLGGEHTGPDDSDLNAPVIGGLPPAVEHRGSTMYVRDCPRAGSGIGCPVYSDGSSWRRYSDDKVMR